MGMASSAESKSLKGRLRSAEKETLYGVLLGSLSPTLAEIAGHGGYDFVVIDLEHGHGDISDALACLRALAATQTAAIIRLPENSATWAKKALDLGPQGLMFPMVNDPESARNAVLYSRYPPNGVRGAAHPAVRASNYGLDHHYLANCDNDLLIICHYQFLELEAVKNKVRDIAAVDGVDCICITTPGIGPWDPCSLIMAEMEKAVLELKAQNKGNGPFLAALAMPGPNPNLNQIQLKRRGYDMVCGALDLALFRDAALHNVKTFKD